MLWVSSRVRAPILAAGERGLGAGVAAADYDDIETFRVQHDPTCR